MSAKVTVLTAAPHRLLTPLLERIKEQVHEGIPVIVLVPEQLTLMMERALMDHLQTRGFFDLDVLSPSRLSERVLEIVGKDQKEPLGEAGQRMAISQTLEKLEGKLPYYGSLMASRGFVEKLTTLMTDMKRGGLDADGLLTYVKGLEEGTQKDKCEDIARIFDTYRTVIKDQFSDGEDQLAYVAKRLKESGYLVGKQLFVYGFDALPERTITLLVACAPLCESVTVGLVCVDDDGGEALYEPILQGIARLRKSVQTLGVAFVHERVPIMPLEGAPMRAHLDEQLYRFTPKPYAKEHEAGIWFYGGLSPFEEATTMSRLVLSEIKKGTSIEKIAVVYPDDNGYPFAVRSALHSAGIAFYSDQKMPAISHGLIRFFLSALRTASQGYRSVDVMSMIKSGYTTLSFEEGCEIEQYAIAHGINLKRWTEPFTRGETLLCEHAEALRQRLIAPVMTMRASLVSARTTEESVKACFTLLEEVQAYQKLQAEEERLLMMGYGVRANQNSQIWQAMLSLFEQVVRLGGGARVPIKYIAKRFACGFSAISLASLPPASEMLQVGTLGHILASDMDVVFLMGMNDGILKRQTIGLLTEEERIKTQEATGCYLGLSDQNRSLLARIDVKQMVTLPKEKLYVSSAKTDPNGQALRPLSLLVTMQEKLFPTIPHIDEKDDDLPMSSRQALSALGLQFENARMHGLQDTWQERFSLLASAKQTAEQLGKLCRAVHISTPTLLGKQHADALFGDRVLSVSRLEQFANCPFKHFLSYGLRLHEQKEWAVDPIETGNFYHDALHRFADIAMKEEAYPNVPIERIVEMANEALQPLQETLLNGPMGDGKRNLARFTQAYHAIVRSAENITKQLAGDQFHLQQTEASFGFGNDMPPLVLTLSDGREVMLQGRIDRIDRFDTSDGAYLRVIDYKSSSQELVGASMWAGIQLQLLLYLDVCVKATMKGKPAGAFYFHVTDPLVKTESDDPPIVEKAVSQKYQLKGIALADDAIIQAKGKTLDEATFGALIRHTEGVATHLAEDLLAGHVEISPMQDAKKMACDHCDYRAICHFDPSRNEEDIRMIPAMDMGELQQALMEEEARDE